MKYKVHGAHLSSVNIDAKTADGRAVVASQPVLLVELVPIDEFRRSFTHVVELTDKDVAAAAREKFKPDAIVEITVGSPA